ncbi:MAG: Ig-like domain-containing protein, partial [Gemmatimonadaceae bacterium]
MTAGIIAFGMGCGEGTAPPAPVATVSIVPSPINLVAGGTEIVQAVPKDAGGNTLTNRMSEWSTSNPSIATVAAGVITGVALGTATITATVEGQSASAEVNVREGAVVSTAGASFSVLNSVVSLDIPAGALSQTRNITIAPAASFPANARVVPGTTFDFGPTGTTFAQPVTISIKYDPSKVINSPDSGLRLYEVIGTGWRLVPESSVNTATATVTGKVNHFAVYGVLLQAPVATITINRDTTIQVQKTLQFAATLKDSEQLNLNRVVTWSSSNPAVVSIDANGLASTHLPGQSTITAAVEGKTATATVIVVPGPPTALSIDAGQGQTATAGSPVATAPAVKVTDAFGNPVSGFAITFAVASGGGTITGAAATTNAAGVATLGSWTLGTTVGANTLTATGAGLTPPSVTFTAAGGAGSPSTVVASGGNNQTGTAGGPVATPPSVKVTDSNGNPVQGFTVVFAPGAGSGSVTGGSVATNSSGIAAPTRWVLGSTPGTQTLVASAGSLSGSPVTFSATAVAPIPAKIVSISPDNQTAITRRAVGTPPAVRVLDAADVPVPGYTVTFAVTSGGGSVTGATAVTNESGNASAGSWVLGPTPGTNTLTATAGALQGSPITFTATAIAASPVAIAVSAGQNQSAAAGSQVPVNPAVLVTDASGMGVSGVTVVFSIRSGTGSITGSTLVTDANGIATLGSWTLGLGANSLFASAGSLSGSPLVFNALGTAHVQLVTFGDSNTDYGYSGNNFPIVASSYVGNFAPTRLGPNDPNSSFQLSGKIESRWRASRSQTIVVVNHGIGGTTTGTGRTII